MIFTAFLSALIALLATAMLLVCAMSARTLSDARLRAFIAPAYEAALAATQQSVAADYAAGLPQRGLAFRDPAVPITCASDDDPCAARISATATFSTQTPPAESACGSAPNCAQNLQRHAAVAEGRATLHVMIEVTSADGARMLARDKYLTLRTFSVAPYAAVIGERDATSAESAAAGEGDNAGESATRIAVKFRTPGRPDVEQDAWATQGWAGGNASQGGWSP